VLDLERVPVSDLDKPNVFDLVKAIVLDLENGFWSGPVGNFA
jgi:hypothetical protein